MNRVNINEDMVCAGQGRRDSCAGDSGGPMLSNFANGRWSVIGIVSFGVDCASERHPGYVLYLLTPINAHFILAVSDYIVSADLWYYRISGSIQG